MNQSVIYLTDYFQNYVLFNLFKSGRIKVRDLNDLSFRYFLFFNKYEPKLIIN